MGTEFTVTKWASSEGMLYMLLLYSPLHCTCPHSPSARAANAVRVELLVQCRLCRGPATGNNFTSPPICVSSRGCACDNIGAATARPMTTKLFMNSRCFLMSYCAKYFVIRSAGFAAPRTFLYKSSWVAAFS